MRRVITLPVAVMAFCLLCGASGRQKPAPVVNAKAPILLRLRFQKDMTINIHMLMDQQITQSPQGQKLEMNQKIGMGYSFHVLNIDSTGAAKVEVVYQSVLWKQSGGPTGTTEYDSTHPPHEIPPMAKGFAGLLGQKFTMQVAQDGKISEIKGIDEMYQNMLKVLDLPEGPQRDQLEKTLKAQFGEKSIKDSMDQLLSTYPERPLAVGDSWTKHSLVSMGFPMIIDNTTTLTARDNGVAHLKIHSDIKPNSGAPPMKIGDFTMAYKMSGEQNGTLTVDEATGWMKRGVITQNFTGNITMSGAQAMTWPITIKGTVTISSE